MMTFYYVVLGEIHVCTYVQVTFVSQKSIPSAVVYYYCAWYTFLRNRRYMYKLHDSNVQRTLEKNRENTELSSLYWPQCGATCG